MVVGGGSWLWGGQSVTFYGNVGVSSDWGIICVGGYVLGKLERG